jgi:predicted nucleic acid-binding Zn ribbon protein
VTADGVLWVRVTTSAWANELSLMAPRILAKVNQGRTGQIRDIRWLVGHHPPDPR